MACWRQRPNPGQTVHHSDHGHPIHQRGLRSAARHARLLDSMGTVGDALDNAAAESFLATLQTELVDRRSWATKRQLARAIFEWIEVFYNQQRRHSTIGMHGPSPTPNQPRALLRHDPNHHTPAVRRTGGTPGLTPRGASGLARCAVPQSTP